MANNGPHYLEQTMELNERLDRFLEKYGSGMNFEEAKTKLAEEGFGDMPKSRYKSRVMHYRIKHKPARHE